MTAVCPSGRRERIANPLSASPSWVRIPPRPLGERGESPAQHKRYGADRSEDWIGSVVFFGPLRITPAHSVRAKSLTPTEGVGIVLRLGMDYKVTKGLLGGKRQVKYACPQCGEGLHSPLEDAGNSDTCPACGVGFTVPGERELLKQREEERASNAADEAVTHAKQAEQQRLLEIQRAEVAKQRREEEKRIEARAKRAQIILTSTHTVEGRTIVGYLGIESVEVVMGSGIFSEVATELRDFFGARSKEFETKLGNSKRAAMDELRRRAAECGADAVVGVDLDYTEFSGNRVALIVNGTMVKLADGGGERYSPAT